MVEKSTVLFARLYVELFHELPPLPSDESDGQTTTSERQFLRRCQIELESSSSPKTEQFPLVYVDNSTYGRLIETVRVLAEVFKNLKITEATRKRIIQLHMNHILPPPEIKSSLCVSNRQLDLQAVELENNYNEEVKLRKEAEDALARKKEEVEMLERSLESYKKEQAKLQLEAQTLEHKHDAELQLRRETEIVVAVERDYMTWKDVETLEEKHEAELKLRKEAEIALDKERKGLEGIKQLLETCIIEQDNLKSQVVTWKDMYDQESSVRKETKDALSKEKQDLETVKALLKASRKEADAMRQERDDARKTAQELVTERQPPSSFLCPITQDVMKDPIIAADGFTYEAEDIKKWLSIGHKTSPMTNLTLAHLNLIPNRALRSAIEELV
ncbi:putative U-box domain-containing protein 58 [Capsella rubella]|uniref:putative U-box domain-containing protein 58 n=1 Tax=Capsella rubella TaxID=81985 RepID=UPI000CD4B578|nr:putative U-box domain-containing protein 58 [Capsella rubella]